MIMTYLWNLPIRSTTQAVCWGTNLITVLAGNWSCWKKVNGPLLLLSCAVNILEGAVTLLLAAITPLRVRNCDLSIFVPLLNAVWNVEFCHNFEVIRLFGKFETSRECVLCGVWVFCTNSRILTRKKFNFKETDELVS